MLARRESHIPMHTYLVSAWTAIKHSSGRRECMYKIPGGISAGALKGCSMCIAHALCSSNTVNSSNGTRSHFGIIFWISADRGFFSPLFFFFLAWGRGRKREMGSAGEGPHRPARIVRLVHLSLVEGGPSITTAIRLSEVRKFQVRPILHLRTLAEDISY